MEHQLITAIETALGWSGAEELGKGFARGTSDNPALESCRNVVGFRVGGGSTGGEDDDDGTLPNTGGPHLWILFAGLALVVAGGGLAGGTRRASATA